MLHEGLITVCTNNDIPLSALMLFCDETDKQQIEEEFLELAEKEFRKLGEEVNEQYEDAIDLDEDLYCELQATEYGLLIKLTDPAVYMYDGDTVAEFGIDTVVLNVLKELQKKYSSITYKGYIAYAWSDSRGGEVRQYEVDSQANPQIISENGNTIYDYVGESLKRLFEELDDLVGTLEEASLNLTDDGSDLVELLTNLHAYEKWLPDEIYDAITELADNYDESVGDDLKDMIESWADDDDKDSDDDEDDYDDEHE